MAIKHAESHKALNGWFNRSCQRWNNLRDKNLGEWLTNPIGIVGGVIDAGLKEATDINNYTEGTSMEGFSFMPLNKLWRLKLILNRNSSLKEKYSADNEIPDLLNTHNTRVTFLSGYEEKSVEVEKIKKRRERATNPGVSYEPTPKENTKVTSREEAINQDRRAASSVNQIVIISPFTSPYKAITLQCRPDELQVTPHSTWAAVSSMGRNDPFRMYTGGEDTIQFDISWFSNDPNNRGEVVTKCRLLESWTKADGYKASPPVLQLLWGSSNIYKDDLFILESAPYKLTNFQNMTKNSAGDRVNLGLYPNHATQTLVFKRVSSINRTWDNIVSIEELKKTTGITVE